jgi:hypothetical protein
VKERERERERDRERERERERESPPVSTTKTLNYKAETQNPKL